MNPEVFGRVGDMSAVIAQPTTEEERRKTIHALLSCPTFSIHARKLEKGELAEAQAGGYESTSVLTDDLMTPAAAPCALFLHR